MVTWASNARLFAPVSFFAAFLSVAIDVVAPNKVWTTDITYVWTLEGWLYVAIVLDFPK